MLKVKKIQRALALLMVAAILIGLVAMTTGCSRASVDAIAKDPEGQIRESMDLTMEALKSSGANSPIAYIVKTIDKGAFKVQYGDKETTAFTNTLYFDSANDQYADSFVMESADEKTTVDLYLDEESAVIKLPAQAGGKTLGVNFNTLLSDMENADAFWKMTGTTYEDFESQYGDLIKSLTKHKEEIDIIEFFKLKSSIDEINAVIDECKVTVEEKKVLTNSKDVKAIDVTYSMTTEQLNKIVDIAAVWFDENFETIFEELTGMTTSELGIASIFYEVDDIKGQLKSFLRESNANVKMTFSINPNNELIMKAECVFETNVDNSKEYVTISLDLGEDLRKSSEYQLNIMTSSGVESSVSKTTIGYQIMDSEGMYHRRVYCTSMGDGVDKTVEMELKWNTKSEVYELLFDSVDGTIKMSGAAGTKDGSLWFTIDKVVADHEETAIGARFEFTPGVEVPQTPQYQNIFKLPEEDWDKIKGLIAPFLNGENFGNGVDQQ